MKISDHQNQQSMNRRLRVNQLGMASFVVSLILMLVITLIVLGFSQIARRNEREALDSQLSNQAFYAAESGVNFVQNLMKTGAPPNKASCVAAGPYVSAQVNDVASQVANTCLLVNNTPDSLIYDNIDTNNTVIPLQASGSPGTGTLTIVWQSKAASPAPVNACSTYRAADIDTFTPTLDKNLGSNCPYGVLRLDIVDATAAGALTPATLEAQTMTIFAPPTNNAPSLYKKESGNPGGTPGNIVCVNGANASCTLTINNFNFSHIHYMRAISYYRPVAITSINGVVGGTSVKFVGAQILVDSTGKAVDVLRRIQVRLNEAANMAPPFAIENSGSVCKIYTTTGPGSFSTSDSTNCPVN